MNRSLARISLALRFSARDSPSAWTSSPSAVLLGEGVVVGVCVVVVKG